MARSDDAVRLRTRSALNVAIELFFLAVFINGQHDEFVNMMYDLHKSN